MVEIGFNLKSNLIFHAFLPINSMDLHFHSENFGVFFSVHKRNVSKRKTMTLDNFDFNQDDNFNLKNSLITFIFNFQQEILIDLRSYTFPLNTATLRNIFQQWIHLTEWKQRQSKKIMAAKSINHSKRIIIISRMYRSYALHVIAL